MQKRLYNLIESFFIKPALMAEMIGSLRQLSVMYAAGIPFARALYIIAEQTIQPKLKRALAVSQRRIETGSTIAASLSNFPEIFPELYVRLMEVGESTGKLEYILDNIANHAEKNQKAEMKLRSALVYPTFVLTMCLVFLIVGPAYLFRGLYEFLTGLNIPLPAVTKFLVEGSKFMRNPLFPMAVIAGIILCFWVFQRIWQKEKWRYFTQNIILATPGIGPFYQSSQVTIFARTLAIIYDSGMPIVQGIELVRNSMGLLKFRYELDNVLKRIIDGETIQDALCTSGFFPPVLTQFIRAGEESGDLGHMLNQSAWICEQNNDLILETVMEALQPIVLFIIGIVVGFLIIATMAPMMSIIKEIS